MIKDRILNEIGSWDRVNKDIFNEYIKLIGAVPERWNQAVIWYYIDNFVIGLSFNEKYFIPPYIKGNRCNAKNG